MWSYDYNLLMGNIKNLIDFKLSLVNSGLGTPNTKKLMLKLEKVETTQLNNSIITIFLCIRTHGHKKSRTNQFFQEHIYSLFMLILFDLVNRLSDSIMFLIHKFICDLMTILYL